MTPTEPRVRFQRHFVQGQPDECWPWTGALNKAGYGHFAIGGRGSKQMNASRAAYIFAKGEPGDQMVLHSCDNPPCVNPSHLYLGNASRNERDKHERGRAPRNLPANQSGSANGNSKLEEAQVREIRSSFEQGVSRKALAQRFAVSRATVEYIINRVTWKHVE